MTKTPTFPAPRDWDAVDREVNDPPTYTEIAASVPTSVLHAATHGGPCLGADVEFFSFDGGPMTGEDGETQTPLSMWIVVGNYMGSSILYNDNGFITAIDPSDCPGYDDI